MSDRHLPRRLRALARVLRGERTLTNASSEALRVLVNYSRNALHHSGMDPSTLDSRAHVWRTAVTTHIAPTVETLFTTAFADAAPGVTIDPNLYATRHLESVWNRLVGVADEVFGQVRTALAAGRDADESIPQLAARVDALLDDTQRWRNRAVTIARTETIAANNAGSYHAASAVADLLGHPVGEVVKEWLATADGRTRETHAEADGQQVTGMGSAFTVGDSALQYPGDPSGSGGEVINCRCTVLYHHPGDSDYPALAASATTHQETPMTTSILTAAGDAPTGAVIVALPAAGDPCQVIGPEQKHATLVFLGEALTADQVQPVLDALTAWVPGEVADDDLVPFTETVTGVESLGDDGARVWTLDPSGTLPGIHDALLAIDSIKALSDAADQYPSYTPHVTIGYPPDAPADAVDMEDDDAPDADDSAPDAPPPVTTLLDDATEAAAAAIQTIDFDRIALWFGTVQQEWPLGDAADPADAPAEAPVAPATPVAASGRRGLMVAGKDVTYFRDSGAPRTSTATYAPTDAPPAATPAPGDAPAGGPGLAQDIAPDGDPFYGVACPEGVLSGDARRFGLDAITWRDLPLPLMYQDATAIGHDGAVRVGRIDTLDRDVTGAAGTSKIRYTGVWDTSAVAQEAQRQVGPSLDQAIVRGVSVDCDDVTVELVGSDGQTLDPMVDDFPDDGVVIEDASAARICGLTICSVQAFPQAYIANGVRDETMPEPGQDEVGTEQTPPNAADETVTTVAASAAWSLVAAPVRRLPAAAFANPGLTEPTRLTVTDDRRVYGHLAVWGTCHIGVDGLCQEPPASPTNYAYYAVGCVDTDAGLLPVGQLTMDTGHAAMNLRHQAAAAHYDNTGSVVADVTMGQDGVGIWFAGILRSSVTDEQVHAIRASGKVSGDWRDIGGSLELVAALVVNVPGFSIPRPAIAASGGRAMALVASGIVGRDTPAPSVGPSVADMSPADYRVFVSQLTATLDRRDRARRATARLRQSRVTAAVARLDKAGV